MRTTPAIPFIFDTMGWFTDVEDDVNSLFYDAYCYTENGVLRRLGPSSFSCTPDPLGANTEVTLWVSAKDSAGAESEWADINVKASAVPPDTQIQTYVVTFNPVDGSGALAATVDGANIVSPTNVQAGKSVVFTAAPNAGYQVKEWRLNSTVVTGLAFHRRSQSVHAERLYRGDR